VNGDLDLECPKGVYLTKERIMPLIESGVISEETIDRTAFGLTVCTQVIWETYGRSIW